MKHKTDYIWKTEYYCDGQVIAAATETVLEKLQRRKTLFVDK